MKVLFLGLIFFCAAFLMHFIIWKINLPKKQTKSLLLIFFGTFCIGIIALWGILTTHFVNFALFAPINLSEYLHVCLFFTSITFAYVVTYPAIEVDSPSLLIIMSIYKAGSEGFDKKKLYEILTDDILVKPRIKDLIVGNMIYMDMDKLKLTKKGIFFVRIFIMYRELINAQKGG